MAPPIEDLKTKAATEFEANQWEEAIELYSQAIVLNAKDVSSIANRSAAYVKSGRLADALKDAQNCRSLEPTNSMGYIREAAVLLAEHKYQESTVVLKEGLGECGDKKDLQTALRGAQRALIWKLPASQAARKMMAAYQAAQIRQSTLTPTETKVKPLFGAAMKNREILLAEFNTLGENPQVLEILFHFVLESTDTATLAASGLPFPADINAMKDQESFVKAISAENMGASNVIATQLIQGIIQTEPTEIHNKDCQMMSLFSMLDQDGASDVAFLDLAKVCYGWALDHPNQNLQSSTQLLVLMDPYDSRRLDYAQFGKFLLSLASTWNEPMEDALDDLILVCANNPRALTEEELQAITVGDQSHHDALDPLSYARTKQLFEIWDTNNDGSIDFAELLGGLRRYQQATQQNFTGSANAEAQKIALMIMGHDEDHNQTLDPDEFAVAMVDYAKAAETDLHELIDFMAVVIRKKDEDGVAFEKAYSEATVGTRKKAFRPSVTLMAAISDIEEDSEEESDEEE